MLTGVESVTHTYRGPSPPKIGGDTDGVDVDGVVGVLTSVQVPTPSAFLSLRHL